MSFISETVIKRFKNTEHFEAIGLVVWSTQLHEEMHLRFLIAGNGAPLCVLISGLTVAKFIVPLLHKLVSLVIFWSKRDLIYADLLKVEMFALKSEVCGKKKKKKKKNKKVCE